MHAALRPFDTPDRARASRTVQVQFGTKAETLERLARHVTTCRVPELDHFTQGEWLAAPAAIIDRLRQRFGGGLLAVRSSALNEDGAARSMAGAFHSVLKVDSLDAAALRAAIEEVLASYHSTNPGHQVLVQPMLEHVAMNGVLMTHDLTNGAPYYIINYDDESGRTDVITGGTGVNKTLIVHREAPGDAIESGRVAAVLGMARELEQLAGGREPLDIEFAQTQDGQLYLLQARRIAVQKNWNRAVRTRLSEALEQLEQFLHEHARPRPGLPGDTTILGQMPDWNPAELIGTEPSPLATSLFRHLISDSVWQEARAGMGYRPVPDEPLLVTLAGRPYIDVRNSFSSFLPFGLPPAIETAVVNAWLHRLAEHPEFHDKVEFEVAQTVYDFAFEQNQFSRYAGTLSDDDRHLYAERLRELTARNVTPSNDGTLAYALRRIAVLERKQADGPPALPPLRLAFRLLAECRQFGTLPFSMIARHAFMAETLLRSAIRRGAWTQDRLDAFKRSLVTPAGRMSRDFNAVLAGRLSREGFLAQYGHLRPGTFDILSPRYDQREELFRDATSGLAESGVPAAGHGGEPEVFQLEADEREAFAGLLAEIRLGITPEELLTYAARAIAGREQAKFVFTRHLSDAIECIAEWGEHIGLAREDLACLTLRDLDESLSAPVTTDREAHFHALAERRTAAARETRGLRLGYILRDTRDLYVVPLHRGAANFVTRQAIEAPTVLLNNRTNAATDLFGRIVCIESADPGFDWIFTKHIAGLVTKFGGANSHMTIRCAELGIPAAIGVGEATFDRLASAGRIDLRCGEKVVRPSHG